jgi:hypothetical protein
LCKGKRTGYPCWLAKRSRSTRHQCTTSPIALHPNRAESSPFGLPAESFPPENVPPLTHTWRDNTPATQTLTASPQLLPLSLPPPPRLNDVSHACATITSPGTLTLLTPPPSFSRQLVSCDPEMIRAPWPRPLHTTCECAQVCSSRCVHSM